MIYCHCRVYVCYSLIIKEGMDARRERSADIQSRLSHLSVVPFFPFIVPDISVYLDIFLVRVSDCACVTVQGSFYLTC